VIGLEMSVHCEPVHRTELLQSLRDLCSSAARESRCQECRVFEDVGASERFLWLQWWRSQRHLEEFLASTRFRTLVGAIKVLGTLESARIVDLQDSTPILGAMVSGAAAPTSTGGTSGQ
jgi:quinol monooxygenase YgiN